MLFQPFFAARSLLTSSSNSSSVRLCPEIAYHVTVAIPSVAVSTHLNRACMKHIELGTPLVGVSQEEERTQTSPRYPLASIPRSVGKVPRANP